MLNAPPPAYPVHPARETGNVLRTTRIDLPFELATADGAVGGDGVLLVGREGLGPSREAIIGAGSDAAGAAALEGEVAASCRVELPGIRSRSTR